MKGEHDYIMTLGRDLAEGRAVILSDIDGTGSPFVKNPADAYLDAGYANALKRINRLRPGEDNVVFVTGRDRNAAEALLNHPLPDGTKADPPEVPKVVSHGAEYIDRDGNAHEMPQTEGEKAFVSHMKATTLNFKKNLHQKTPELADKTCFEFKKNSIVVNVNQINDPKARKDVLKQTRRLFKKLVDGRPVEGKAVENPRFVDDKDGRKKKNFSIKDEEGSLELRNDNAGKDKAVVRFGLLPEGKRVIWMGDSLGATGTDRGLAETVNSMAGEGRLAADSGVFHVLSSGEDKRITDPKDPARPVHTVSDPHALGSFLKAVATSAEAHHTRIHLTRQDQKNR